MEEHQRSKEEFQSRSEAKVLMARAFNTLDVGKDSDRVMERRARLKLLVNC